MWEHKQMSPSDIRQQWNNTTALNWCEKCGQQCPINSSLCDMCRDKIEATGVMMTSTIDELDTLEEEVKRFFDLLDEGDVEYYVGHIMRTDFYPKIKKLIKDSVYGEAVRGIYE